ncbi:hypothetical protein ACFQV8_04070 [Pseudonocardia benzenivorans]
MTGAGPEPGSLEHTLLGTRRWPGAAVVAVVLRSVRWPYSCGLAAAVRESAHRYADAGAELHVTVDEPLDRRTAAMAAWGLPPPLPAALAEPLARVVGSWDPALARADDGLGCSGPTAVGSAAGPLRIRSATTTSATSCPHCVRSGSGRSRGRSSPPRRGPALPGSATRRTRRVRCAGPGTAPDGPRP